MFNDPAFSHMERAMDRAFERAFAPVLSSPMSGCDLDLFRGAGHAFDIVEKPDAFELVADAPGFSPSDVNIELTDRVLTISGKHTSERKQQEGDRVLRSERRFMQFTRTFTLPDNTKPEDISAALDKGVLTVRVPKTPEAPNPEPKRITVTVPQAQQQGGQAA